MPDRNLFTDGSVVREDFTIVCKAPKEKGHA